MYEFKCDILQIFMILQKNPCSTDVPLTMVEWLALLKDDNEDIKEEKD